MLVFQFMLGAVPRVKPTLPAAVTLWVCPLGATLAVPEALTPVKTVSESAAVVPTFIYLKVFEIEPPLIPTVPVEAAVGVTFMYLVVTETALPPVTAATYGVSVFVPVFQFILGASPRVNETVPAAVTL